jgi:D-sedoheptulose 7-phosphate isomerase
MQEIIKQVLNTHIEMMQNLPAELWAEVENLAKVILAAFKAGKRVYVFGNGGSAADAQHLAAELVGRFQRERRSLPVYALTTNTSILTSLGNDYSFPTIFAKQIEAFVQPGDVVLGISTSGNSPNILEGFKAATAQGALTFLLGGKDGGKAAALAQHKLIVPHPNTARIQEAHILIIHILCELVEEGL